MPLCIFRFIFTHFILSTYRYDIWFCDNNPKTSLLLTSAGSGHIRTGVLIPKSLWSKDLIKRSIYRRLKINASTSWHPCFYPRLSICWPCSWTLFPLQSLAWLWSPVALDSNFKTTLFKDYLVVSFFMYEVQFWSQIMWKVCCFDSLGWT